jgi:hypothetical protein
VLPRAPTRSVCPRIPRMSHALISADARPAEERPAGVEPALPPWQGSRLPLHHGRELSLVLCCWSLVATDQGLMTNAQIR